MLMFFLIITQILLQINEFYVNSTANERLQRQKTGNSTVGRTYFYLSTNGFLAV